MKFVWVDIETTGLDSEKEVILELGLTVTNDSLEILRCFSSVVWADSFVVGNAGPEVFQMHRQSGLLDEIPSAPGLEWVQKQALAFLSGQGLNPGEHPMCGSSVHFDRQFLKVHMPLLEEWFFYRNIDVSTLKELIKVWSPELTLNAPAALKMHRAGADLEDTINELRFYRKELNW